MHKQLYLSNINKMIGGVCGGISEYFDIDPVIVRIVFVVLAFSGGGFLAYLILWIIVPRAPLIVVNPTDSNNGNNATNESTNSQTNGKNTSDTFAGQHIQSRKYLDGSRLFAALSLIIVGLFWMLNNIIPHLHFMKFWPIVLIILGILILMKSKNN